MKVLWTDGSASPNPGLGGYAVLLVGKRGAVKPVKLGREKDSTNIRMEGKALLEAMKYAEDGPCEIHTDSEFWINVLTKWAKGWQANGWVKKNGKDKMIANLDLVKKLYKRYTTQKVKLVWVKGHHGIELNELADEWANKAREGVKI